MNRRYDSFTQRQKSKKLSEQKSRHRAQSQLLQQKSIQQFEDKTEIVKKLAELRQEQLFIIRQIWILQRQQIPLTHPRNIYFTKTLKTVRNEIKNLQSINIQRNNLPQKSLRPINVYPLNKGVVQSQFVHNNLNLYEISPKKKLTTKSIISKYKSPIYDATQSFNINQRNKKNQQLKLIQKEIQQKNFRGKVIIKQKLPYNKLMRQNQKTLQQININLLQLDKQKLQLSLLIQSEAVQIKIIQEKIKTVKKIQIRAQKDISDCQIIIDQYDKQMHDITVKLNQLYERKKMLELQIFHIDDKLQGINFKKIYL